jgi:hypothetical protein
MGADRGRLQAEPAEDFVDVAGGFRNGRDAAGFIDFPWSGVVGAQRQCQVGVGSAVPDISRPKRAPFEVDRDSRLPVIRIVDRNTKEVVEHSPLFFSDAQGTAFSTLIASSSGVFPSFLE